jgi:hypothetical protein
LCQQNYKTKDVKGHIIEGINGGRPHRRPVTSLEHKQNVNVSENDSGIMHGRGSVMQMPWMTRNVRVTED